MKIPDKNVEHYIYLISTSVSPYSFLKTSVTTGAHFSLIIDGLMVQYRHSDSFNGCFRHRPEGKKLIIMPSCSDHITESEIFEPIERKKAKISKKLTDV